VLRCETNRHALRSEGTRSLLSGRVGGDRAVAATSRQGPAEPRIGRAFPVRGSEAMASSLLLTSRRQGRATVCDVGVSNR